jgi:HD-GYP domain-containing protein (c-di-GMP phosphodiesterase class II)
MQRKQVSVAELQFGMYVAELDRPWTETPFMFQGFYLRRAQQLEALRKVCRHVFIDAERSEPAALSQSAASPASAPAPGFAIRGRARHAEQADLESEIGPAGAAFERGARVLQALFGLLEKGSAALDVGEVLEALKLLAASVVRNPDALLLMSRMRDNSAAAQARALQVSIHMMVFARFLQLEREEIELLGLLGLLQDIGKTRLPADLLEKQGPLTPRESEMVKKHVELSGHILGATPGLPPRLAALALLHHERQDGSGYPRGLKGYQIGLYGSIAAICDTFDALTALRPYAEQLSPSAAVGHLLKERGAGFHAELVEQFIQCVGAFPVGSVVELSSGETGIVIAQNSGQRLKPTVVVMREAGGGPVRSPRILFLDEDPKARSGELYRIRRTLEQSRLKFDPRELFRSG